MDIHEYNQKDPYENLSHAVILQAVEDYRRSSVKLKRTADYFEIIEEKAKIIQIENFFESSLFNLFSGLDGKVVLLELKKEII